MRLAEVSRRLDQTVYRRLHIDRLASAIGPKIPPRMRKRLTYLPLVSGIVVIALSVGALRTLDGPLRTTSPGRGTSSPGGSLGVGSGEEATSSEGQDAFTESSPTGRITRGGTQGARSGTVANTEGLVVTGRGVTDSTITIGVIILRGLNEMRQALTGTECGGGNDCGDNRKQAQAAIDYINSQGGVAKRKVVPVYHEVDVNENFDVSAQRACADFTEDHEVFAVADLDGSGPWAEQLIACLSKRDTPRIGYTETDQKFADDHAPYFYAPSFLNFTRAGPIQVLGLMKQGYFEQAAKIGLLRYDRPSDDRTAEVIKRTLGAQGLKLTDEVAVSYPSRISDLSTTSAESSNAALRFRSNGVTHLLIQDRRTLALVFMGTAESQGYRPRYGLTSFSQPQILTSLVPAQQFHRALGVGWLPVTDVHPQRMPPPKPSRQACIDIMKKAGLNSPELDQKGLSYCDDFFFLKMAGDSAKVLTTAGFQTAAEELGARFEPLLTHTTRFGQRRHDGANGWRPLAFDDGCRCFHYVGDIEPVD